MHENPSPLAGQTVRIKSDVTHPQVQNFGGSEFVVEDWWDRLGQGSWMKCAATNPACIIYALRLAAEVAPEQGPGAKMPIDDEVLYGKVDHCGHLVHISEIEK